LLIGQLNKALLQINEAIQKYPENLEIRLLWINTLIKTQKENEVKEYLRTSPRFQDALPEEQMRLSRLLSRYEQYEDARQFFYLSLP
jgi:thioredoxin-like negative regulator of GroEL